MIVKKVEYDLRNLSIKVNGPFGKQWTIDCSRNPHGCIDGNSVLSRVMGDGNIDAMQAAVVDPALRYYYQDFHFDWYDPDDLRRKAGEDALTELICLNSVMSEFSKKVSDNYLPSEKVSMGPTDITREAATRSNINSEYERVEGVR